MGKYWDRTFEYLGLRRRQQEGYHQSRYHWVCDRCGATVQPESQDKHDSWHRSLDAP